MFLSRSVFAYAITWLILPQEYLVNAFAPPLRHQGFQSVERCATAHSMVGGRGWDNSDYLGGLSGDEHDLKKATEEYQDFSDRRQAFLDRQKEMMNTPKGRAFLDQQERQQAKFEGMDDLNVPSMELNVQPGSGGGSRMAEMMARARQMKDMKQHIQDIFGEQKFAVPLDDDADNGLHESK